MENNTELQGSLQSILEHLATFDDALGIIAVHSSSARKLLQTLDEAEQIKGMWKEDTTQLVDEIAHLRRQPKTVSIITSEYDGQPGTPDVYLDVHEAEHVFAYLVEKEVERADYQGPWPKTSEEMLDVYSELVASGGKIVNYDLYTVEPK